MCKLEKFYCIYGRGGISIEGGEAPSLDDFITEYEDNGETFFLTEHEAKWLQFLLNKEFGIPKYSTKQIKELEQHINYAMKHHGLDEETAQKFLVDLEKGFDWFNRCVI